jgi:hypothetical protein
MSKGFGEMPTKIVDTKQIDKQVIFLTDPVPHFVSLVNRGANQEPWIVVKQQKEENSMAVRKVLQAIVVPNGTPESVIRSIIGDEIPLTVQKTQGDYTSYELLTRDVCKADSFELVYLSEENTDIKGLAAEMLAEKSEGWLKRLLPTKKKSVLEIDMDTAKRDFSDDQRKDLADQGKAMPDGSFPIVNGKDLENAIHAVGRAKDYEKAKQHIIARARALGMTDKLPEDWQAHKYDFIDAVDQEVEKVGKKISAARLGKLKAAMTTLRDILDEADELDEETTEKENAVNIDKCQKEGCDGAYKCDKCKGDKFRKGGACAKEGCDGHGVCEKCQSIMKAEEFNPPAGTTGPNYAAVTCWKCGGEEKADGFCVKCGGQLRKVEEKGENVKKEEVQAMIVEANKPITEALTAMTESIKTMGETVSKMQKTPSMAIKLDSSSDPNEFRAPVLRNQSTKTDLSEQEKADDELFAGIIFNREACKAAGVID